MQLQEDPGKHLFRLQQVVDVGAEVRAAGVAGAGGGEGEGAGCVGWGPEVDAEGQSGGWCGRSSRGGGGRGSRIPRRILRVPETELQRDAGVRSFGDEWDREEIDAELEVLEDILRSLRRRERVSNQRIERRWKRGRASSIIECQPAERIERIFQAVQVETLQPGLHRQHGRPHRRPPLHPQLLLPISFLLLPSRGPPPQQFPHPVIRPPNHLLNPTPPHPSLPPPSEPLRPIRQPQHDIRPQPLDRISKILDLYLAEPDAGGQPDGIVAVGLRGGDGLGAPRGEDEERGGVHGDKPAEAGGAGAGGRGL